MEGHTWVARYRVHWLLTVGSTRVQEYGTTIRTACGDYGGHNGDRLMTCSCGTDIVDVGVEITADDVWAAIDATRTLVTGPLERANLTLPELVTIVVGRMDLFRSRYSVRAD